MEIPPFGGCIVERKYFLVEHAPLKLSHVGTVIIQARRHLLDFGEMTSAESAEFGSIMRRLVPAVKAVTGAHRIYYLSGQRACAAFPPLARTQEQEYKA
jgi:diadenosine tetraphosphate (Ap4A) HIT family hydrolase